MNYEENEMEPWPSELGNIGDENAMNDDIMQNPASKRPKYIYRYIFLHLKNTRIIRNIIHSYYKIMTIT